MYVLTPASWAYRSVGNPRMLHPGGEVGPGTYVRRNKNLVTSAGLIARNEFTAAVMPARCGERDKCLPRNMTEAAVGAPVSGSPGKTYRRCTDEEAASRLRAARECAIRELSTKGGIYSTRVA